MRYPSFVFALLVASALHAQSGGNNILMIVADDIGVDNIGAYAEGPNPPPTPTIDALAQRGVLFRNTWSNPVCSPTRACIMTGRYGFRTGIGCPIVIGNTGVLQLNELTIPELLDRFSTGYAHAAIGKWHLGDERNGGEQGPNLAGFSHYAGLLPGATHGPFNYYAWLRTVNGTTALSLTYTTTTMVDDALDWIGQQNQPWFCYLAFNAAHDPFQAPPAHLHTQNLTGLDPATTPIPFYKATIEAMDTEIDRLLRAIPLANTDIIFVGDNGTPKLVSEPPFLPSHAKATPYEGGVNVPLIIAGPSVNSPGRESQALVDAVDLFSTALELAGAEDPLPFRQIDGVSIVPLLQDPGATPQRTVAFSEKFTGDRFADSWFALLRGERYKLIRRLDAPVTEEFYDLQADAFETNDLLLAASLTPAQQTALTNLRAELDRIRDRSGSSKSFGVADCVGSNGNPAIAVSGTPQVDASYDVQLSNAATSQPAALLIGLSRESFGGVPLPYDLSQLGSGPGCLLYTSIEFAVQTMTDPLGQATIRIDVPNQPELIDAPMEHTWLVRDPTAPMNPAGITASNGAHVVVGA